MKKILFLFLIMASAASHAQVVNGGMETWRTYSSGTSTSLTAPVGWNAFDSILFYFVPASTPLQQTFQNDSAHSGSYAVKLMTRYQPTAISVISDELSNCALSGFGSTYATGGTPVSARIDTVTAWIKYEPRSGDSGMVQVEAVLAGAAVGGADSVIGSGLEYTPAGPTMFIVASPTYTKHAYKITYAAGVTAIPDHIQITFYSSFSTVQHDSTTMYVDDVSMHIGTTEVPLMQSTGINVYPNPAGNVVSIRTAQHTGTKAMVYYMAGQCVASQPLTGYMTGIDVSRLPTGVYTLTLVDAAGRKVYDTRIVKQ